MFRHTLDCDTHTHTHSHTRARTGFDEAVRITGSGSDVARGRYFVRSGDGGGTPMSKRVSRVGRALDCTVLVAVAKVTLTHAF